MDSPYLSAPELRDAADAAASTVLPMETAATLPVPVRAEGGLAVIVIYYSETGLPNRRFVHPPTHAMLLDPATGKVLRFWAAPPEELGIEQPTTPVPGVGIDPRMTVDEFVAKRDRFLDISADVWRAFAQSGGQPPDAAALPLVKEYGDLFRQITKKEVAPFYTGAAPDFFSWVQRAAAAP